MIKPMLAAASAIFLSSTAHAAVTVSITSGPTAFAASGVTSGTDKIVTFDYVDGQAGLPSGIAASGISWANDIKIGSSTGNWLTPTGDSSQYLRVQTTSADSKGGVSFAATGSQNPLFDTVSLYWGSIDNQNVVYVYGTGNEAIAAFTGAQMLKLAGLATSGSESLLVSFTNTDGAIGKISLASPHIPLEVDNIRFSNANSTAVPEPATWAMLLVGFSVVGSTMRRRKTMKRSFI
ncbi:PEPxxWA-CTERM sorting domain-containing protein [Sphingobium boeckii]|uniref:Ice-binding protein C-terminal domain-containing protein n=1 Tax=Sphingobium boeckii TaxID=1082345 RepID=A0A7W9AKL9_9SPHN|nr:PEPxxWA-CTERM sorting domain-containing protein [Sphingobium boeckii]MBB5687221.1 hypothetical protein [Sphingobium boeckii]